MHNIERGKSLHCVEMVTGKNLTGTLVLSDESINTRIYSYTEFFCIEGKQPIILQAETSDIVSLHSNVTGVLGRTFRTEPQRTIYRQDIISNLAVIGHDPWMTHDKIKRVAFNVRHSEKLMHHDAKVKAIGRSKCPEDNFTIFTDTADGMTLKASYAATYGMASDTPKELWPIFEIEFDEPRSISNYIADVLDYVSFLSFCFGGQLKPLAIRVDRLSFDEMMSAIENDTYLGDHEVHYVWPEAEIEIETRDLLVRGSPVKSWDDEELDRLRACLVMWMNRAAEWKKAYRLMMTSFGLKNAFSAERLINACRWFENVPVAQTRSALSNEHIEAISAVATEKAQELGYLLEIRRRISGDIKRIKTESAKERFTRLVALIEKRFGKGVLAADAVAHLEHAIKFRNKAAHSHFNPESDAEFRAFLKATCAMEALCYLLMALDLPISKTGINRIGSNPLVNDYRLACD